MKNDKTLKQLLDENQELRIRLQEAEETLQAIREGAVDALVVSGPRGEQVFTLAGEDQVYRHLVETMSEAGLTTTLEGRILFCNERFCEMLRRPMEEIVGHPIEEFVRKSYQKEMAELLASAPVKLSRKRMIFLAGDETQVPTRVSGNLLRQADSVSICMVAMDLAELEASEEITRQLQEQTAALEESAAMLRESRRAALSIMEDAVAAREQSEQVGEKLRQEIAERQRAQETLRKSEERYRGLFENMSEGFALHEIICDENGVPCDYRFLEINPSFERLTGLKRADVIGKPMRQVLPDNEPYWVELYGNVALTGKPAHVENYSSPLSRWYEVFAYRPAPGQFAAVFTDITERKRAEEALRQNHEELERFNRVAVGRELRMIELKKEVNQFYELAGKPPRYAIVSEEERIS